MQQSAIVLRRALSRASPAVWRAWTFAAAAYVGLYALLLLVRADGDAWWSIASRSATLLPGLLAAAAAFSVWRQPIEITGAAQADRLRRAWLFFGLGGLLWTLGHLAALAYELALSAPAPLPSIADPLRLAGYIFITLGLLSYPVGASETFGRLRLRLDTAVTSGAGASLVWLIVIRPILGTSADPLHVAWATLYPALDLVMVLILVNVWLASRAGPIQQRALFLLAGALVALALADLTMTYLAVQGEYRPSGSIGLGWVVGYSALGLAAVAQRLQLGRSPLGTEADRWQRLRAGLQALLPLAATLVLAWYVLLDLRSGGSPDRLSELMTVLLAVALVARQGVVAGELELSQYALLVNTSADPAFICDGLGRLRLVNPALLAATGYASEALLRQPATVLFADGVLPVEAGHSLDSIYATGWSGEVSWRRSNGTVFPAYLALRPVLGGLPGRPALVGTAHDLTLVKLHQASLESAYQEVAAAHGALADLNAQLEMKVEEKTRSLSEAYMRLAGQHEALQTLDQLKSEFVSLVSHELRAPLTNVSGGIELMLAGQAALPDRTRRTLQLVQTEIHRLTHFVETILDLSALEAGRLSLDAGPVDVRVVSEAVFQQLEARPGSERLQLRLPKSLPLVSADERALTSVIFHLIDNALKYAPDGQVSLEASAADGAAEGAGGGWVEIRVQDQGPGVPLAMLEAIFDKFERGNSADNRAVYGHGLGLYMARRLLTAQGGDIRAANTPDGGACFTFWLPSFEAADGQ